MLHIKDYKHVKMPPNITDLECHIVINVSGLPDHLEKLKAKDISLCVMHRDATPWRSYYYGEQDYGSNGDFNGDLAIQMEEMESEDAFPDRIGYPRTLTDLHLTGTRELSDVVTAISNAIKGV